MPRTKLDHPTFRRRSLDFGSIIALALAFGTAAMAQERSALSSPERSEVRFERSLQELARDLAAALGAPGARDWLLDSIESSRYVEQRIAFRRALTNRPELVERLAVESGFDSRWSERVAEFPDLELYFPIPGHLEAARQQHLPIDVAIPAANETGYIVFSANGKMERFGNDFAPEGPTLRLGRSEIDFDHLPSALEGGPMTASFLRRQTRATGALDGRTSSRPWAPSTPSSIIDVTQHTYLTRLEVKAEAGNHQDLFEGKMEIEVFGFWTLPYQECVRITGVSQSGEIFDLPSFTHLVATAVPTGSTQNVVKVLEDDRQTCVEHARDESLGSIGIIRFDYDRILSTDKNHATVMVQASSNVCGDSLCEGPETCDLCPECGPCPFCGDGSCNGGESCATCSDCGPCPCGDGFCGLDESCLTCQNDCGPCQCVDDGICTLEESIIGCADCCQGPENCEIL